MNQNNNYILKAIDILMDKRVDSLPMTKVFSSPIYGVNTDGTYTIVKEKNKYSVRNGLSSALSLGQNVWVMIPNGSLKDMFICGLNKTGAETYSPSGDINELTNLITQLDSVVNGHNSSIERLNDDVDEMNIKLSGHIDNGDVHISSDEKTILETVTIEKINSWDNKSDFDGDYNSLDNLPTIPSTDGLATETYVDDKIEDLSLGDENVIESISANGVALTITDKNVNIAIPEAYDDTALTERIGNVEDALDDKAETSAIPDVSNFVEKEEGNGLFSGSYNDLIDTPTIPSVDGLVSEEVLNTTLADYVKSDDLPSGYDDTELTNRISAIETNLGGHTVKSDVPENAKFTDTVYDDTALIENLIDVEAIAKGKNRARVFSTTEAMKIWLSDSENMGKAMKGDNLYIVDLDVPDWWVADVLTEVDVVTGYYYKIAQLETQKVDLTTIEADINAINESLPIIKKGVAYCGYATTVTQKSVTFDEKFDVAPIVLIAQCGIAAPNKWYATVNNVTTTGFTINTVGESTINNIPVHWVAIANK